MTKQEIINLITVTIEDEIKSFVHPNPYYIQNHKEKLLNFQTELIKYIEQT